LIKARHHKDVRANGTTDAPQGVNHQRPAALLGGIRRRDARDVGGGLDQRFARAAQRLIVAGKGHFCAHRFGADPGVGRQPDRIRLKLAVITHDTLRQHAGIEREFAQRHPCQSARTMHRERSNGGPGSRFASQGTTDKFA
jgi:hypothetical protein